MPEFQIQFGSAEGIAAFKSADSFVQGYIEAMFFTDIDNPDRAEEFGDSITVADIAPETWDKIKADCAAFQAKAGALLADAYDRDDYDAAQAGRDYWFSRNGHGVGYWDRKQLEWNKLGDRLHKLCGYSEQSPYRGDDGKLYLM